LADVPSLDPARHRVLATRPFSADGGRLHV